MTQTADRIRVLHISTGLLAGGAEVMLLNLLRATDRDEFDPVVLSLTGDGVVGPQIRDEGFEVHALGMTRGRIQPGKMIPLVRLIRNLCPDVIQTWMYHADLVGGLAARWAGTPPVCWGIHHTTLVAGENPRTTLLAARLCAATSRLLPSRIVCCSEASRVVHIKAGYPREKMVVIPNGFDIEAYAPDLETGRRVRTELDVPQAAPVVGLVARFDPQKDHRNFVNAAAELVRVRPDAVFLLCGLNVDQNNEVLVGWIRDLGLESRFRLLGLRSDVPRLVRAFDVSGTSSAFGEAFPLVVGEAMASGVPCVVTDVGDSAEMVGDTGVVVPPRDPIALAAGWRAILDREADARVRLGEAARARVLEKYNLPSVARRYEAVHREATVRRRG